MWNNNLISHLSNFLNFERRRDLIFYLSKQKIKKNQIWFFWRQKKSKTIHAIATRKMGTGLRCQKWGDLLINVKWETRRQVGEQAMKGQGFVVEDQQSLEEEKRRFKKSFAMRWMKPNVSNEKKRNCSSSDISFGASSAPLRRDPRSVARKLWAVVTSVWNFTLLVILITQRWCYRYICKY